MQTNVPWQVLVAVFGIGLIAVAACSSGVSSRPIPTPGPAEPTPVPRAISIPSDEQSHDERLEWWYYNGHLAAESGREFGFHFVVFQALGDDGEPSYASQLAITDVDGGRHVIDSRLFAGEAETATADVFGLMVNDWSLGINDFSHSIAATMDDGTMLELQLDRTAREQPVLHGDSGWFTIPGGWSYYYSWPDMHASGTLILDGVEYSVTGTGWFDHQWGDFFALGAPGGWQWLALHLGNGETLMVTETRRPDGTVDAVFGTWSDGEGRSRAIDSSDVVRLDVLETWISPHTGAEYPAGWRLQIDGLNLDVEIFPVIADQEVTEGIPRIATYWEGKLSVYGTYRGAAISQPGYVELTGYVDPQPIPWRTEGND